MDLMVAPQGERVIGAALIYRQASAILATLFEKTPEKRDVNHE
jgi:hypothetical protein